MVFVRGAGQASVSEDGAPWTLGGGACLVGVLPGARALGRRATG